MYTLSIYYIKNGHMAHCTRKIVHKDLLGKLKSGQAVYTEIYNLQMYCVLKLTNDCYYQ